MSAFVASDRHINAIVKFGMAHAARFHNWDGVEIKFDDTGRNHTIARILYRANVDAVNQRYNMNEPYGTFVFTSEDVPSLSALEVIKACNCYEYQASEWTEYFHSGAYKAIRAVIECAIPHLEGYSEANGWSID